VLTYTLEGRSETPSEVSNVVLEQDGKDQLHGSSEKKVLYRIKAEGNILRKIK
jgi:hypothetical protein